MSRVMAWLRYQGWRNAYWREDWHMETCPHDGPRWREAPVTTGTSSNTATTFRLVVWTACVACGKPLDA